MITFILNHEFALGCIVGGLGAVIGAILGLRAAIRSAIGRGLNL